MALGCGWWWCRLEESKGASECLLDEKGEKSNNNHKEDIKQIGPYRYIGSASAREKKSLCRPQEKQVFGLTHKGMPTDSFWGI